VKPAAGEPWKCRSVERMEIQKRDSHSSHDSLGISPTARDSHIPTAPAAVGLREERENETEVWPVGKWKPKTGFHFPTAPAASGRKEKTQKTGDTTIEVRTGTFLKKRLTDRTIPLDLKDRLRQTINIRGGPNQMIEVGQAG
jgi:hypothetical protein